MDAFAISFLFPYCKANIKFISFFIPKFINIMLKACDIFSELMPLHLQLRIIEGMD
jgi:hypothetical protein